MRLELMLMAALALGACDDGGGADPAGADGAVVDLGAGGVGGGAGGVGGGAGGVGGGAGGVGGGAGGAGGGEPEPRSISRRPNLRFKGADRLQRELMRVLDLEAGQLCQELGQYDCIDAIHTVPLGGVEAYTANIYVPFPNPSVAAPLIVERLALSACTTRIGLDRAPGAEGLLWSDIPLAGGRLADVDGEPVTTALNTLFTRALLRPASEEELDGLRQLYRDVEAGAGAEIPALAWAQVACMAVLTSTEFLFY